MTVRPPPSDEDDGADDSAGAGAAFAEARATRISLRREMTSVSPPDDFDAEAGTAF